MQRGQGVGGWDGGWGMQDGEVWPGSIEGGLDQASPVDPLTKHTPTHSVSTWLGSLQ